MHLIDQPVALTSLMPFTSNPVPVGGSYANVVINMAASASVSVQVSPQTSDDAENWTDIGDVAVITTTGLHTVDVGTVEAAYIRLVLEETMDEGGNVIVYSIDLSLSEQ